MAYNTKEKQAAYNRLFRERNLQSLKEYAKQQRASRTEEEQAAYLEYQRRYREANREKLLQQNRERYRNNKEECARAKREARKRNPEHVRAIDRRSREKHIERVRAAMRRWHEQNRERQRERSKQYRQENYEQVLERNRNYRKKQPDKVKGFEEKYRASHPEVRKTASQNRCARQRGAVGKHTSADVLTIWDRQQHRCAVPDCPHPIAASGKNRYHVDHIMPLRLGGSNYPDNLQILCGFHNISKNCLHPDKWKKRIGLA